MTRALEERLYTDTLAALQAVADKHGLELESLAPMLEDVLEHRAEVTIMRSWKSEVIADSSGTWCGNALRFATRGEAEAYGADLASRWTLVRQTRTVRSDDPITHAWTENGLVDQRLTAPQSEPEPVDDTARRLSRNDRLQAADTRDVLKPLLATPVVSRLVEVIP